MKHFWLKFNHGIEVGAALAYEGHYKRTKDPEIFKIIQDEKTHCLIIEAVLTENKENPNLFITLFFNAIGNTIKFLCGYCPLWSLNIVARMLEHFAVYSYFKLADKYPEWSPYFYDMAKMENQHAEYFKCLNQR